MNTKKRTRISIGQLAAWGKAVTALPQSRLSAPAGTVWMDSRKIAQGDIFVALTSDTGNGHEYVQQVLAAGATTAIVAKSELKKFGPAIAKKLLVVDDPLKAVSRMAKAYREYLDIPVVGVTGSSGKTTTRNLIARVLRSVYVTGETFTNWNNHIGVPLSILRFGADTQAAVLEMGANHVGEIHPLSMIAQPDIAVITNIGYGHVGLFGSLANTLSAKLEIIDGMNRREGFLMVNGDDHRLVATAPKKMKSTLLYGFSDRCDIRAESISLNARKKLSFEVDGTRYRLSVPARHFVMSALPAIAMGMAFGISRTQIVDAIESFQPVDMRGTVKKIGNVSYIVDCYNANPSSMEVSLDFLKDISEPQHRVAVVGDMLELGSYSSRLHTHLGKQLVARDIRCAVVVGEYAQQVVSAARAAGMNSDAITAVENADAVWPVLSRMVQPGDFVLVKGSRGIKLEKVIEQAQSRMRSGRKK